MNLKGSSWKNRIIAANIRNFDQWLHRCHMMALQENYVSPLHEARTGQWGMWCRGNDGGRQKSSGQPGVGWLVVDLSVFPDTQNHLKLWSALPPLYFPLRQRSQGTRGKERHAGMKGETAKRHSIVIPFKECWRTTCKEEGGVEAIENALSLGPFWNILIIATFR